MGIPPKFASDARESERINGNEPKTRHSFQAGCLFKRGTQRKTWVARWRETVIQPDGTQRRVLRSEALGPVSDLSFREARQRLADFLRPHNDGKHRKGLRLAVRQAYVYGQEGELKTQASQQWLPLDGLLAEKLREHK